MDRFSRDAGEAMSMVKMLQRKYSIQVVSVTEGITFRYARKLLEQDYNSASRRR
jgi:hypothetical protein